MELENGENTKIQDGQTITVALTIIYTNIFLQTIYSFTMFNKYTIKTLKGDCKLFTLLEKLLIF